MFLYSVSKLQKNNSNYLELIVNVLISSVIKRCIYDNSYNYWKNDFHFIEVKWRMDYFPREFEV